MLVPVPLGNGPYRSAVSEDHLFAARHLWRVAVDPTTFVQPSQDMFPSLVVGPGPMPCAMRPGWWMCTSVMAPQPSFQPGFIARPSPPHVIRPGDRILSSTHLRALHDRHLRSRPCCRPSPPPERASYWRVAAAAGSCCYGFCWSVWAIKNRPISPCRTRFVFIDGVYGDKVPDNALPPEFAAKEPSAKVKGSWRAHMNAIQEIVRQNLTSALILEDDVDWDVRVKSQFQDFARATRLLVQPLIPETGEMGAMGDDEYLDSTFPSSAAGDEHYDIDVRENDGRTKTPTTSPYGDVDRWDLLWPGHCGANFPKDTDGLSLGRAILYDDETAAEARHFDPQWGDKNVIHDYPDHTRITYRGKENVCNLAYALTRDGARRALYELGVHKNRFATDLSLRDYCDGTNDRPARVCLTVQPPLMMHHNPVRKDSTGKAISKNIRWGMRVNFPKLLEGAPVSEYIDHFKDEGS
nr:hypothetical protein CFP56_16615 [Quercus suber]